MSGVPGNGECTAKCVSPNRTNACCSVVSGRDCAFRLPIMEARTAGELAAGDLGKSGRLKRLDVINLPLKGTGDLRGPCAFEAGWSRAAPIGLAFNRILHGRHICVSRGRGCDVLLNGSSEFPDIAPHSRLADTDADGYLGGCLVAGEVSPYGNQPDIIRLSVLLAYRFHEPSLNQWEA